MFDLPNGIQSFRVAAPWGSIEVELLENGKWTLWEQQHMAYIDRKGNISWKKQLHFNTNQEAYDFALDIIEYFKAPLPDEDVLEWFEWITEGHDNKQDIEDYRVFATLLVDKQYKAAYEFMRSLDTFVREGVSQRIWFEIGKHVEFESKYV